MLKSAALHARLLTGAIVVLCACAGKAPPAAQPELAPTLTIERFLRAANQNDLDTMASLFGTRDGAITRTWSRDEIDARMFLLASVLRHSDYAILREQIVPGRRQEATQFVVQMKVASDKAVEVPFTLVRTARSQQWLIENIQIEQITRGRGAARPR